MGLNHSYVGHYPGSGPLFWRFLHTDVGNHLSFLRNNFQGEKPPALQTEASLLQAANRSRFDRAAIGGGAKVCGYSTRRITPCFSK
jgi:hypothetical protein